MIRRVTTTATLAAAVAFVGPGLLAPVHGAAYPADSDAVVVVGGSTDVEVGDEVQIQAKTFEAQSDVTIDVSDPQPQPASLRGGASAVLTAASGECETGSTCVRVADADGVADATIRFTAAGEHVVRATGVDPDGEELVVEASFDVAAAGAGDDDGDDPQPGGLASTGSEVLTFGAIGLGLVALGALVVGTVRRRISAPTGD